MAYIVNVLDTNGNATASTTFTVALGAHSTNDLLLACVGQDGGGGTISVAAGWTMIGTQAGVGGNRQAWAYKIAASGAEANPLFTSGISDDWCGTAIVIRDADATAPIEGWMRSDWNLAATADSSAIAASSAGGTTLFTASQGSLLLYSWSSDTADQTMRASSNQMTTVTYSTGVALTGVTQIIGFRTSKASSTPPSVTMYKTNATDGGNGWVLSIKNKAGGTVQPFTESGFEEYNWYGAFGTQHTPVTWQAPSTFAATIAGFTVNTTAPTTFFAGVSGSRFSNAISVNGPDVVAQLVGGSHAITAKNIQGKLVYLEAEVGGAGISRLGTRGLLFGLMDGAGAWAVYELATPDRLRVLATLGYVFDPDYFTPIDSSGTLDLTNITRIGLFASRASSGSLTGIAIKNLFFLSESVVVGGGAALPASVFRSIIDNNNGYFYLSPSYFQGASQSLLRHSIQIGDGATPTYFSAVSSSSEYPAVFDGATQPYFAVGPNTTGITVVASAADTIDFSSSVLSASQQQAFVIDATSSTSAAYNFDGLALIGFLPTWKTGVPAANISFRSCGVIDGKAATFSACTIAQSTSTTSALILEAGGEALACAFTKGQEGYAIELTTAGDYDLSDTTFSGYTTELNVSAATGTVIITLAEGQTAPDYTSAGATVNFVIPVVAATASIINIVPGSRLQVFNVTEDTEMVNTIVAGTSWSASYPNGTGYSTGDVVRVRLTYCNGLDAKLPLQVSTVAASGGWTVLADQQDDEVYIGNGIDGSTVTEYASDYVNVQIDISDPDAVTTIQRGYAWYCDQMTGDDGIRFFYGAMVAEDALNYLLDTDVADIKVQNTNMSVGVSLTGGALRRKDGSSPIAPGGSVYIYYGRTYGLETGVSGLTPTESDRLMQTALETTALAAKNNAALAAALSA